MQGGRTDREKAPLARHTTIGLVRRLMSRG